MGSAVCLAKTIATPVPMPPPARLVCPSSTSIVPLVSPVSPHARSAPQLLLVSPASPASIWMSPHASSAVIAVKLASSNLLSVSLVRPLVMIPLHVRGVMWASMMMVQILIAVTVI